MLNLIHAAVRVFLDVLAVAFVLEHTRELHEKHREINDAPKQVAGVVDEPGEAVMAYVQRTVCMNTADAIDPGIQPVEVGLAAGEWVMYQLQKGRE